MIIYKTINKINSKSYIGKDKNNNPQYLGSGVALKLAIKKYGKENFVKEIVEICINENVLNEREIYWIKYFNAVKSKEYYNMKDGGNGGSIGHSDKTRKLMSKLKQGTKLSEETRKKISITNSGKNHPMFGKKQTLDAITKMKKNTNHTGEKNPMFGKKQKDISKELIREKRKQEIKDGTWKNPITFLTDEENELRIQKISKSLQGKSLWNKNKNGEDSHIWIDIDKKYFIELLKTGKSNQEMSEILGVSQSTVVRRKRKWQ